MSRPAALMLLACLVLYGGTLDHFFVSDDFLNLERNGFRTIGEALSFFSTRDVDFWRPLARLHFGVMQGFFGDRVVAWNLLGVLIHGLVAGAVAFLGRSLFGEANRRAARWAGLFFAVHFIHVEPVVWASGVTTTWVTLFVLVTLLLFRRSRRTGSPRDRVLAVVAFFLALLSKETAAVTVPLLLFVTAWWPGTDEAGRPLPRRLSVGEIAPYAVLLAAWLLVIARIDRGGDASPYRMLPGLHVVKNLAFLVLSGFVPVRYWQIQQLWAQAAASGGGLAELLPAVLRRLDLGLPLVAGAVAIAAAFARGGRDVRGALLWIPIAGLAFLPLPGSGERFAYLPSVGACLVLGLGAQALLRRGRRLPGGMWTARAAGVAVAVALAAGNLDRQADWAVAARWTKGICDRWSYFRALPADRPIEFVGIPDAWRSAWVFRNGFDSMARLYWEGRMYRREGEMPAGSAAPLRMRVALDPRGTVGMIPTAIERDPETPGGTGGPGRPGRPGDDAPGGSGSGEP